MLALFFLQNSLEISQGCLLFASLLKTSPSSTRPVRNLRERDVAGMTLQASEGQPGLGTDVFVLPSLPGDEEGSELEQTQVQETMAPGGSQVCRCSWGEGSWPLKFSAPPPQPPLLS